jgi:Ser/Thr protein kinase RdoA (MazF antagonist)
MTDKLLPSQISAILRHISDAEKRPVSLAGEPEKLSGGARRSTHKISTDHGAYVVSISTAHASASEDMHKLHHYFYENGAPVARPVGGIGELPSGDKFVVSEFVKGKSNSFIDLTEADMEAFGKALAKTHTLSEQFFHDHHIDPNHESASWRAGAELLRMADAAEKNEVKNWLRDDKPMLGSIMQSAKDLREVAYDMPTKRLKSGLVHRDAHPGNMIVGENGQVTLIDIESAGRGIPFQDVAVAMTWGSTTPWKEDGVNAKIFYEKAEAFLKGYDSVKPLSAEDRETIFTLIKNQAKATATLSNMNKFNPAFKPDDYFKWSKDVGSWADRVMQSGGQAKDKETIR